MSQIVNRIDHVAWMVLPENHDAYVKKFEDLLGVTFEADDGTAEFGLRLSWSWSAGLEILSPLGREHGHAQMCWDFLDKKGEGLFAMVFGVRDVPRMIEHARSLGYQPSPLLNLPPTDKPWRARVQDCTESVLEVFLGQNLAVGSIITDENFPPK